MLGLGQSPCEPAQASPRSRPLPPRLQVLLLPPLPPTPISPKAVSGCRLAPRGRTHLGITPLSCPRASNQSPLLLGECHQRLLGAEGIWPRGPLLGTGPWDAAASSPGRTWASQCPLLSLAFYFPLSLLGESEPEDLKAVFHPPGSVAGERAQSKVKPLSGDRNHMVGVGPTGAEVTCPPCPVGL